MEAGNGTKGACDVSASPVQPQCTKTFCGGVTKIKAQIMEQCSATSKHFLDVKQSILDAGEALVGLKHMRAAANRKVEAALNKDDVADLVMGRPKKPKMAQQSIEGNMNSGMAIEIDNAIAELFYGTNNPATVSDKPLFFKSMIEIVKTTP